MLAKRVTLVHCANGSNRSAAVVRRRLYPPIHVQIFIPTCHTQVQKCVLAFIRYFVVFADLPLSAFDVLSLTLSLCPYTVGGRADATKQNGFTRGCHTHPLHTHTPSSHTRTHTLGQSHPVTHTSLNTYSPSRPSSCCCPSGRTCFLCGSRAATTTAMLAHSLILKHAILTLARAHSLTHSLTHSHAYTCMLSPLSFRQIRLLWWHLKKE